MAERLEKLWVEKYRPKSLDDYVFQNNTDLKLIGEMLVDEEIPNLLFSGVQGSGKAQPLHSKILTPFGWKTMGEIKSGDDVITPNGLTTKVKEVFPQGKKEIYTITFHDGSSTDCCLDHLWECYVIEKYRNRKTVKKIFDTQSIINFMETQGKRSSERFNISIPLIEKIDIYEEKVLPIPPYILGVFIGDGSLHSGTPRLTTVDEEIVKNVSSLLNEDYKLKLIGNTTKEYHLTNEHRKVYGGTIKTKENMYTRFFRESGLYKCHSYEKFIPKEYKEISFQQRISLLQGLLDTDGTIDKKGSNASFSTTSKKLAHDVQELLWSIGATCTITSRIPKYTYKNEIKEGRKAYTLFFNHNNGLKQFFSLSRKKDRGHNTFAENHNRGDIKLRRRVKSIEYKGIYEAKCILIDNNEHLYVTDDYIVTHNTTICEILLLELGVVPIDVLRINASEMRIEDVRDRIKNFVTTLPIGKFKVVFLEEADYIPIKSQGALRKPMEEFSNEVRFMLTCNYPNKIMPALKSRCQHFSFHAFPKDKVQDRIENVLVSEKVKFTKDLVDTFVSVAYPDIRKIINLVQQHTFNGELTPPTATDAANDYKIALLGMLETDSWVKMREELCPVVAENEWEDVYRFLYENLHKSGKFSNANKWEEGILIISGALYKHGIIADPEIGFAECLIRLKNL